MANNFTKEQIYSDVDRILSQVADLESWSFEFIRHPDNISTAAGFVRQIRPYVARIRNYKSLSYPSSNDSNFFYRDDWDGTYFFKERTDENGDCHGFELCYESQGIFTVRYNGSNGREESFSIAKWQSAARIYTYRRDLDGREVCRFQWQNVNGSLLEI